MSNDDLVIQQIAKKSTVTVLQGTFVSVTATACVVDVGNGRVPAHLGTSYLPEINEAVFVWFIDGNPFVMGPATTKPGKGTVVSVASGLVTLTTDFGTVSVPYSLNTTPAAGQIMKLTWQGGGYAESVMSTTPVAPVPPPAPNPATPTAHVDVFTAVDAGSRNGNGWWTNQVRADNSDLGAWWYGSKISDTVPASAVASKIEVYVSAAQIQGSNPNFALHSDKSKPAGAPALGSITAVAITPGWVTLPIAFANSLKGGGGAFGLGVSHGGFNIFNSLTADGQSGAIRISSTY